MADKSVIQRRYSIPKSYDDETREEIAEEIVDYLVERSKAGKGKDGKPFPKYTKEYRDSLNYKIAKGGQRRVDLTLSGEMLNELEGEHKKGEIIVGYDEGSDQAGKAEGNILGTYGQAVPDKSKARDFLALSRNEIRAILANYPLRSSRSKEKREETTRNNRNSRQAAENIVNDVEFDL